ncbi:MAG: hypothetical protein ACFCUJ_07510 [Thiotrichales bacterium]
MATPKQLFSLIESPTHPNFAPIYRRLGLIETRHEAARKLHQALKQTRPDYLVGEFIYGYGNNYAGVNVCNLDVTLHALQRFSPQTRVIVLVDKEEAPFVSRLTALFPIHAVLVKPVAESALEAVLTD